MIKRSIWAVLKSALGIQKKVEISNWKIIDLPVQTYPANQEAIQGDRMDASARFYDIAIRGDFPEKDKEAK